MALFDALRKKRDTQAGVQSARDLFVGGHFSQAAVMAKEALAGQDGAENRNILGLVQLQSGNVPAALAEFARAVELDGLSAEYRTNLGLALRRDDRFAEAEAAFGAAIGLDPRYVPAQLNRASLLLLRGRYLQAAQQFESILRDSPDLVEAQQPLSALRQAAPEDVPRDVEDRLEEQLRQAARLEAEGEATQAGAVLQGILQERPTWAEAYYRLGRVFLVLGKHEESEQILRVAIGNAEALGQLHVEAFVTLTELLKDLNRRGEALEILKQITQLAPTVDGLIELGLTLGADDDIDGALKAFDAACRIAPLNAMAPTRRGSVLMDVGRVAEAAASCDAALAIDPQLPSPHVTRGTALVAQGRYAEGFAEYEWRLRSPFFRSRYLPAADKPVWTGDALEGRTVLVYAEQGFGDTIQFAHYIPRIAAEKGGRVVVLVHEPLRRLFEGLAGVETMVSSQSDLPPFDCLIAIMSLPLAFGVTAETVTPAVPYLGPPPELVAGWAAKLGPSAKRRIGVCWAGRSNHWNDARRSMPRLALEPLAKLPGIELVSLQVGDTLEDEIVPMLRPGRIADFADTAALMANLDAVISVDTSVAHLAGAMGKRGYILLPHAAEWRWGQEGEISPWYSTMRLVRQPAPGDWKSAIGQVAAALTSG